MIRISHLFSKGKQNFLKLHYKRWNPRAKHAVLISATSFTFLPYRHTQIKMPFLYRVFFYWWVLEVLYTSVFTHNALQRQNTEISKQIFPEKEYRGLIPNFHIPASVSDLYIPTIGMPNLLKEICRPILGIYKSLTDTWKLKLGLRLHLFPEKE